MAAWIVPLVFKARQVVPCSQQKSEGNAPPQGVNELSPPHVFASLAFNGFRSVSGLKSSATQITRAVEGQRKSESANTLEHAEDNITVQIAVPAVQK